jgi:N-acetylneuraminate synthase
MNETTVRLGNREVGFGQPCYVIAEIGINHNGSLDVARQLIEGCAHVGCDAVKFQKRTPELCVPKEQWYIERDTPWGRMTYIDYRHKLEFGKAEFEAIDAFCREKKIHWFVSCWDEGAVDFMEQFDTPVYKTASASLTDLELLAKTRATGRPIIMSTGAATNEQIQAAVATVGTKDLILAHTTSTYPCPLEELNLRMIKTLENMFPGVPVGYSGHETGLATTEAAVVLGACLVERHVTLDRAMWGSDQAASVELIGMERLVRNIRDVEKALGTGVKQVYDSELKAMARLRRKK